MSFVVFSWAGAFACLAFFFAGIVDSISGGGGLITIPVMLLVGIPVHFITGTNQFTSWIGSWVSAGRYVKSGKVHLPSAMGAVPFAIIGAYLGARCNLMIPEQYLQKFMLIMVVLVAIFTVLNRNLGDDDRIEEMTKKQILVYSAVIGFLVSFYQGFYGPGGGTFFMLAYAVFLKLSLVRATGNTRLVSAISCTVSVCTYALSGAVLWSFAAAATIFYVTGSFLGAGLAIHKGSRIIRPIMYVVVALLVIRLGTQLL